MSNVVAPSKPGSLVDLEVALEAADTQRLFLLVQWVLEALVQLLVDQVVSEEGSAEALMVDGDEVVSGEASKIVEVTAGVEEVLDIKEAVAFKVVAAEVGIVVGMVDQMATLPQMLQLVQEVVQVDLAVDMVVDTVVLVLQIATLPRLVVGMIHAVAHAHMMTETADTVAAYVATEIVMDHPVVEVAAIWSR